MRDVDVAVEIGKGIIDAGALAAGLLLTGPAGVIAGLGIETLAIGLCVEHGDDEEAIARTVGVIAGVGLGAVSKYADDVADLTDDTFGSVYKNSLDDVDGFKGLNLDESSNFFKNADEVVESSLDANLLDEMANSEVKYNPDNINLINRLPSNQGYDSFKKLKNVIGSPGEGNHWHHIVEQSQIGKSGFDAQQIHNTSNIIAVNATTHTKITGYYNTTTFRFTNGLSVRDWLAGQSYEYQYEFGLDILRQFGAIE